MLVLSRKALYKNQSIYYESFTLIIAIAYLSPGESTSLLFNKSGIDGTVLDL